jgi:hypothetical protein
VAFFPGITGTTYCQIEKEITMRNLKKLLLLIGGVTLALSWGVSFSESQDSQQKSQHDQRQISPERMHEHMKARLDKLAERLEIKSSQQAAWEEFAKSVEPLVEPGVKKPNDDADAATIVRYRAERATEFAKKLTGIADATAKLQKILTADQRKILDQVSRRFLHKDQGWQGHSHEWGQRGGAEKECHHDEHGKGF